MKTLSINADNQNNKRSCALFVYSQYISGITYLYILNIQMK